MVESPRTRRSQMSPERQRPERPASEQVKAEARETAGEMKEQAQEMKREARGMGSRMKQRASRLAESQKDRVAGGIDQAGQRLEQRGESLERQGGLKGKAGQTVERAGERVERGADYLRTHGIGSIRDDATRQIRDHPFMTVGAALGSGFALGWLLHGGEEKPEREKRYGPRREAVEEPEPGAFGQLGRALLSGATAMAAREVRKRAAGSRNR